MALSDGLLGGLADLVGGYFGRVQAAKQAAMEAPYRAQLQGLLGEPGANDMGPPDAQGGMGYAGGRGLLADPTNPQRQLAFAAGLAQVPTMAREGLGMLQNAFSRAQQQQFETVEARQEQQFGQSHQLQQDQFAFSQAQAERQASQWWEQFREAQKARQEQMRLGWANFGLATRREDREAQQQALAALVRPAPTGPSPRCAATSASARGERTPRPASSRRSRPSARDSRSIRTSTRFRPTGSWRATGRSWRSSPTPARSRRSSAAS